MTNCCFPVNLERPFRTQALRFSFITHSSNKLHKIGSKGSNKRSVQDQNSPVVCFGEILIDFVSNDSGISLAEAPGFQKAPGGAPANVALAIARLGGYSAFMGKVANDEFGCMSADVLKQNKDDNSGMCFDLNARTALSFVALRFDGEHEFMFHHNPSSDMVLNKTELDETLIRKASVFHYGAISLIEEPCKSAQLAAIDIAKKVGCILSYAPNLRLALWPSAEAARSGIMSIWYQADIIKVSLEEVEFLTESNDLFDDDMVMNKLFHCNLKLLLVTEGSSGCRYYTQAFQGRVSGVNVDAVNTVGAGDAFVGGILSKLAADRNLYRHEGKLRETLLFANACSAVMVTQKGAVPALPTKEAVFEILSKIKR